MIYRCSICDQEFSEIPPNTVQISNGRGSALYRFPNGQIHNLKKIQAKKPEEKHEQ